MKKRRILADCPRPTFRCQRSAPAPTGRRVQGTRADRRSAPLSFGRIRTLGKLSGIGIFATVAVAFSFPLFAQPAPDAPRYTATGQLQRPANYREWIWLSSGLGMSYGPTAANNAANPPFDNVFVVPAAYRSFLKTGTWPDQTMFVLEIRAAESHGSINRQGHFQGALRGIEVEVKDERRFPGKWAFFGFQGGANSAAAFPRSAACYSCHSQNGAVDNTFVQFYPTLLEIARQKGTLRPVAETPVR